MTRYFFDVIGRSRSEYDSRGTPLSDLEGAYKWAQLLAVALQVGSDKQELVGGEVRVRRSDQSELFSIPIGHLEADLDPIPPRCSELEEGGMKSLVIKRSIMVAGRWSSVSLEEAFWNGLKGIASDRGLTLSELVDTINSGRQHSNLSSAIRLFVLDHYRTRFGTASGVRAFEGETTITGPTQPDATRSTTPLRRE